MTAAEFNARRPRNDLTGQTFGRLTVIERAGRTAHGHATWTCLCACGTTTTVTTRNLRGTTTSCGCARREQAQTLNRIHGETETALHRRWQAMLTRVTNPNSEKFADYGGRGITIAERWLEPDGRGFMNFRADMGDGFREDLTLDRIDVNGPYTPENCRWATAKQQARNTRRNRYLTLWGKTKSLAEWCELLGLKYDATKRRLQRGWSAERTLTNDAGAAAVWNKLFPVGTPVVAYPGIRPDDPIAAAFRERATAGRLFKSADTDPCIRLVTRTRSVAEVLGGHTNVVWVDGHEACIALTHIDPITEGAPA